MLPTDSTPCSATPVSSPALSPARGPYASRKRASPMARPLPASVAWLNGLTLEMATRSSKRRGKVVYALRVHYTQDKGEEICWSVRRSFEQYRAFQKRLLQLLRPAHKCAAECRWLHGVVKHHFPRPTLFGGRCPTLIESRRKALLRLLSTVQASILNYGNHGCDVLMGDVSQEFASFVMGSTKRLGASASAPSTPTSGSDLDTLSRVSSYGEMSDEEEGEGHDRQLRYELEDAVWRGLQRDRRL